MSYFYEKIERQEQKRTSLLFFSLVYGKVGFSRARFNFGIDKVGFWRVRFKFSEH